MKRARMLMIVGVAIVAGAAVGGLIYWEAASAIDASEERMKQTGKELEEFREAARQATPAPSP